MDNSNKKRLIVQVIVVFFYIGFILSELKPNALSILLRRIGHWGLFVIVFKIIAIV